MGVGIGGDYPLSAVISSEFSSTHIRGRLMTAVFANQGWGQLCEFTISPIHVLDLEADVQSHQPLPLSPSLLLLPTSPPSSPTTPLNSTLLTTCGVSSSVLVAFPVLSLSGSVSPSLRHPVSPWISSATCTRLPRMSTRSSTAPTSPLMPMLLPPRSMLPRLHGRISVPTTTSGRT